MREFFKNKLGYYPYDYQLKVMETLLAGQNVILSVPTGAGKTWASIMPFLFALENPDVHFPKKMIYSLPLRTLANSIYEDVSEVVKDTSIQTGEYANDIYFENDIVFSTIDQTLSNFLCFPLPLSHRQANINAGALIGSYLVFDEFHLLDEKLSMATTIGTLKMLGNLSRCCIMTATLSDGFMQSLKNELGETYEIITLDYFPQDKAQIGSLKPEVSKKRINVIDEPVTAERILKKHKKKSIVICNRVEKAQEIYNQIKQEQDKNENLEIKNVEVICLHSRFFEKDRKEKEEALKAYFGKKANDKSVILIATQVIEAGMDISCEVMHTEISPISSFLQRAGRCARFDSQTGEIFIYDVLEIEEQNQINIDTETKEEQDEIRKLNNKYLPYNADDCRKTIAELKKYQTLDSNIPQLLIEHILGSEKDAIARMNTGQSGGFNQDKIKESWECCQKNHYRSTIRDIQSVEIILINDQSRSEVEKYPFKYQSIGMYKWSFVGWLNKIYSSDYFDREDWLVLELKEAHDLFLENDESTTYELKEINKEQFKSLPQQVYVNTKYFGYHSDFGFNYQFHTSFRQHSPLREIKGKTLEFEPLSKDSFVEHNLGLIGAFEKRFLGENRNKLNFIAKEISELIEDPEFNVNDLIQVIYLMIILHDYGKLNEDWQRPMQKYQGIKEGVEHFKEILAHTDYDANSEVDKKIANDVLLHNRPAHAGVGAFTAQDVIPELFNGNDYLKSSISMAIARHHTPLTKSYPKFTISEKNYRVVQSLLENYGFKAELIRSKKYGGEIDGFQFQGNEEQILYLFFVRILRLCDQKATENLKKYLN